MMYDRDLRRPAICPKCGGDKFKPILYGFIVQSDKPYVYGGCGIGEDCPDWQCDNCEHQWYDPDDPARREFWVEFHDMLRKKRSEGDKPAERFLGEDDGPPCPACGKPLRTENAKQCFKCGGDWHGS